MESDLLPDNLPENCPKCERPHSEHMTWHVGYRSHHWPKWFQCNDRKCVHCDKMVSQHKTIGEFFDCESYDALHCAKCGKLMQDHAPEDIQVVTSDRAIARWYCSRDLQIQKGGRDGV